MRPGPLDDSLVPRPRTGRVFEARRRVRLGDVGADGKLRLDALARVLQDVATDDRADAGLPGGFWVLRRTVVALGAAPEMGASLELATWCSGTGPRWAERRTDVSVGGVPVARAAALWVHVDPVTLAPVPLPDAFAPVYGPSADGRAVRARLAHAASPPPTATRAPFPLRVVDLDLLGHVNNAVYWAALEERLGPTATRPAVVAAELEIRGGLDHGEQPETLTRRDGRTTQIWLVVGDEVRASLVAHHA